MTWRHIRLAVLIAILALTGLATLSQLSLNRDWSNSQRISVYPINGDNDPSTRDYIKTLSSAHFEPVVAFLQEEAGAFDFPSPKLSIILGPEVEQLPPVPPADRSILSMTSWSLRLRWWLYQSISSFGLGPRNINLFMIYQQGRKDAPLPHSFGLQKGLLGIVHAYGRRDLAGSNNVVLAHELLHIYGASDKYRHDTYPLYPQGFAEPDREPRYPQRFAEIMGGRIPLDSQHAIIPESLAYCLIGATTAEEIGWLRRP